MQTKLTRNYKNQFCSRSSSTDSDVLTTREESSSAGSFQLYTQRALSLCKAEFSLLEGAVQGGQVGRLTEQETHHPYPN